MTSLQAAIKIKNSLNKLDSKDYQNIEPWKMQEAVNTASLRFVRRRIEAKEATTKLVDDLQVLLNTEKLSGSDKGIYFLSHKLPENYFGHSRTVGICNKGTCVSSRIPSDLAEDVNIDDLLGDFNSQPSFDFEQAFHTIGGNKIKFYNNNDFDVKEIELNYYKQPQKITFPGAHQVDGSVGKDMTWQFKDDVADLIIEEAVQILAGNIEDVNRFQIADKNKQENK